MLDQLNKRFSRLYITNRDLHECLNYLANIKLSKPGDVVKRGLLTRCNSLLRSAMIQKRAA